MIKNILYVSSLCSEKVLDILFETSNNKSIQPNQKFHRLIIEGIKLNNIRNIETISALPVVVKSHKKKIWKFNKEIDNGIIYYYPFFLNYPILKYFFVFANSFLHTLWWCFKNKRKDSAIICDVLNYSVVSGAMVVAKLLKYHIQTIVTDLPRYAIMTKQGNVIKSLTVNYSKFIINKFDSYVLLTEQMIDVINLKKKPYIIMEGIVDTTMKDIDRALSDTNQKVIMYAGGLYEKYGVKMLIDAFYRINDNNIQLLLFGSGDMVKDMNYYSQRDYRVIYGGILSSKDIVDYELKASLLINPRFSNEEFSKYSFPSKNMEYMASGTPLLTTKLPGMPVEYYDYVYLFKEENEEAFSKKMKEIISLPITSLYAKGKNAKRFVLEKKNNVIQTKRIIDLLMK